MISKFFSRELHYRFAYIETLFLTALYFGAGYLLNRNDILFISGDLTFLTGFLAVVTLYFGTGSGLFSLGIFVVIMFSFYPDFDHNIFLKELVLVFIFGEFHFYWNKTITSLKRLTKSQEERFEELGKAFYALKVSHDQLELNYVLKPVSLRRSLLNIIEDFKEEQNDHWQNLLVLLEKTFGINKLSICLIEEGQCRVKASSEAETVDENDPLVREVMQDALPVYISNAKDMESRYLAVIPAVYRKEIKALVLIEQMPFMSFKQDNLTAIAFIFDYFFLSLYKYQFLRDSALLPEFSSDFRFEYLSQYKLYETYGIDSAVIVLKTSSELVAHRMQEVINDTMRDLDISDQAYIDGVYISLVLVAFSSRESARGLEKRILGLLDENESEQIKHSLFLFSQHKIFEEYLKV